MSVRGTAVRLFLTCWVVYGAFFATDVVREHYLAAAIAEDASFRVDAYAGLHPDLFETPGRGWHIGNNPGASMIAAIPYAIVAPVVDAAAERVVERRRARGVDEPPTYETEWPLSKRFYEEAWRRGLDVKLGLVAFVTHALVMAPLSAAAVSLMFLVLVGALDDRRSALALALVYAFATPVFFRTGFLNQNLLVGHAALAGFAVAWNPARWSLAPRTRGLVCGLAAGTGVLLDYSGVVTLVGLGAYLLVRRRREGGRPLPAAGWFALGAAGPIAALWFYQWRAFGHPFLPGQHWMPPVEWIELGYRGYGPPQLELLAMLLGDPRFGLFVAGPFFLLALAWPWLRARDPKPLSSREGWAALLMVAGLAIFFSGSNYTRLQFNTGVRYMAAAFPFAFLPAAAVWTKLPRPVALAAAILSACVAVPLAMYREVERPLGVADPVVRTFVDGPELPVHRTVAHMEAFSGTVETLVSPWVVLPVTAAVVWAIWRTGIRDERPGSAR